MKKVGINLFVMGSGERFCNILDKDTGVPLYYPNVYLISEHRNEGKSISTIELVAGSISILYNFLAGRNIDIIDRILSQSFLTVNEIDALRDFSGIRSKYINVKKIKNHESRTIRTSTKYFRLTAIANYLEWLCQVLLTDLKVAHHNIGVFVMKVNKRRPQIKNRNILSGNEKSLDKEQLEVLLQTIKVGSNLNPFNTGVQKRNRLMIMMLYSLGIRGGELLNITIPDIDFQERCLSIRRRPDEKSDTRIRQPLVKTVERKVFMSEILSKEVHDYIINERRKLKKSRKHGYLFVTHKSGPTQGDAISINSYHRIIGELRKSSPKLSTLTGHKLRHSWNNNFSNLMDESDKVGEDEQEKIRSYSMGWKSGSGMANIYNERFIRDKANDAAIIMQNGVLK